MDSRERQKKERFFNALITALSSALCLNITVNRYTIVCVAGKHAKSVVQPSFQAMAMNMRWKTLLLRPHTLHEVRIAIDQSTRRTWLNVTRLTLSLGPIVLSENYCSYDSI
jgi:hypothetical protein